MKLSLGIAIMKSIWKIQVKVVKTMKSVSIKISTFQVPNSWHPSSVKPQKKNDKFEFWEFLFTPASHQTKVVECRLEGELLLN